ncbi:hypothetical protein BX600DRAFT_437564 [Xylariales sp. PMI_506]|nr:hypothetical protein BX600DRAFT_437564 [Xylariales sp. PMI_506]
MSESPPLVSQGYPFQEGEGDISDLGGNSAPQRPASATEIGIIFGVISFVIVSVSVLFIWRARKNRAAKDAEKGLKARHGGYPTNLYSLPPHPEKEFERGLSSSEGEVAHPAATYTWGSHPQQSSHTANGNRGKGVEEYEIENRI